MNNHEVYEAYLAHYGVKGMRWGVVRKKLRSPYVGYAAAAATSAGMLLSSRRSVKKAKKRGDNLNRLMADPNSQDREVLVGLPGNRYPVRAKVSDLNRYALSGGAIDMKKTRLPGERVPRRYNVL